MASSVWRAALHGLGYGAVGAAIVFLTRDRYTLSKDWFLAAMIVAATSSAFALGAWYRVRLLVVALAGLAGLAAGAPAGKHLLGAYEYTVPTPPDERQVKIAVPGGEDRVLFELPAESVRTVQVGAMVGMAVGWLAGALAGAWLAARLGPPLTIAGEEITPAHSP